MRYNYTDILYNDIVRTTKEILCRMYCVSNYEFKEAINFIGLRQQIEDHPEKFEKMGYEEIADMILKAVEENDFTPPEDDY